MKEKLAGHKFDVIYDMNGRELADSQPLIDMCRDSVEHFVYMSSAGVYKPSPIVPFFEVICYMHSYLHSFVSIVDLF